MKQLKKHIYIRKPQLWIEGYLDNYFKVVPSIHNPLNNMKVKNEKKNKA